MTMNKQRVAKELLAVARDLMAIEFDSDAALKKYLKDHPDSNKSNHSVKKTQGKKPNSDGNSGKGKKIDKIQSIVDSGKTHVLKDEDLLAFSKWLDNADWTGKDDGHYEKLRNESSKELRNRGFKASWR